MISELEFYDMRRIAETDPGLEDLLLRAKEYYLLKRATAPKPASPTGVEILAKLRARRANSY